MNVTLYGKAEWSCAPTTNRRDRASANLNGLQSLHGMPYRLNCSKPHNIFVLISILITHVSLNVSPTFH